MNKKHSIVYSTVGWKRYLDFTEYPNPPYLQKNGYEVFARVCKLVYKAWQSNLENTPILKFKNSKILAVVTDSEYNEVLDLARRWFELNEYYEECAWIRDIQKKMK